MYTEFEGGGGGWGMPDGPCDAAIVVQHTLLPGPGGRASCKAFLLTHLP